MKFFAVIVTITTLLYGVFADEVCIDTNTGGQDCLEMPGWESFTGGDLCFSYNGADWCSVTTSGSMHPCSCYDDSETYDPVQCNPNTYGDDNTMCKYDADVFGDNCGSSGATSSGITAQADKDAIVDKHNELRALVASGDETRGGGQPEAANMRKLVWSDELAEVAQRWADQCTSGHDTNRKTATYNYVGQNYAMKANSVDWTSDMTSDDWASMVQMWYDEVDDMPATCVGTFSSSCGTGTIGHYTQVVWAETGEIGCGFVHFLDPNPTWNAAYPYTRELICNYGTAGNFGTGPVYIEGTAGSQCPSDASAGCV